MERERIEKERWFVAISLCDDKMRLVVRSFVPSLSLARLQPFLRLSNLGSIGKVLVRSVVLPFILCDISLRQQRSQRIQLVSVCDVRMQMRRKEGSNTSESKRDLRPDSTSGNDLGSKGGRGGRLVGLRRGLRQAV